MITLPIKNDSSMLFGSACEADAITLVEEHGNLIILLIALLVLDTSMCTEST